MRNAVSHGAGAQDGHSPYLHDGPRPLSPGLQVRMCGDVVERRDGRVDVRLARVEVRCQTNARARPVIDDDLSFQQFLGRAIGPRHVDDDTAAAVLVAIWCVQSPTVVPCRVHEPPGEAQGLGANGRHTDLRHDFVAGARRRERGDVRRAALESLDAFRVPDGAGLEPKWRDMSGPADDRWAHLRNQVRPDVQEPGARSAAEPLDGSADREIDPEVRETHWYGTCGLVHVE